MPQHKKKMNKGGSMKTKMNKGGSAFDPNRLVETADVARQFGCESRGRSHQQSA